MGRVVRQLERRAESSDELMAELATRYERVRETSNTGYSRAPSGARPAALASKPGLEKPGKALKPDPHFGTAASHFQIGRSSGHYTV